MSFKSKKITALIKKLSKKYGVPVTIAEAVIRSQFEAARIGTKDKLNIRFPYLGLLYHRDNKNPEYLKMKENEKKTKSHEGL